jgi:hypothetical protein
MNYLLKAMGFWIWGLVAIGLSVSVVSVSYRMLSAYRSHDLAVLSQSRSEVGFTLSAATKQAQARSQTDDDARLRNIAARESIEASNAAQANQDALNSFEAAEHNAASTSHESKSIQGFQGYSNLSLDKFKATQAAYEAALSRGAYKEEELARVFRALFQLAAALQQPAKAIEYGARAADLGALKSNDLLIMSQIYYQQRDCKNSGIWGDKAIAAFKTAGDAPKELLYQLKLQCASDANDTGAMKAALYDLVRLTNKASYWNNLLRLERQDERDDHNTLMIYRIMFDTRSMNADTDYIEMAQLLGDAALAGEAQGVLEKAMSSGMLKDEHKERTIRLLDALKTRADADLNRLPALEAEARKNPAGTDEAYVSLGRSLTAEKDLAGARQAFAKLKLLPNISPRVLKLWSLYADMLAETASEPL